MKKSEDIWFGAPSNLKKQHETLKLQCSWEHLLWIKASISVNQVLKSARCEQNFRKGRVIPSQQITGRVRKAEGHYGHTHKGLMIKAFYAL